MQQGVRTTSRTVRFALGGAAVLAIAGACGTRIPGNALAPEAQNQTAAVQTRADSARAAVALAAPADGKPYFEFQVEKPVTMIAGGKMQYPAELRAAGVTGVVLASYVVDERGVVDQSTFKVLKSDHELFTNAAREALAHNTFTPAEVGGKRVKQLVQQPFVFSLSDPKPVNSDAIMKARRMQEMQVMTPRDNALPMTPSDPSKPYFEFQVEKPAAMRPGTSTMVYPPMLRSAQVEGTVLASFVVDSNGEVDLSTFKVLKSDHELFTHAVKTALAAIKYLPAEVGGQKVKQLVQQPFVFSLAR